jgi:mannose-6-phosphate isomerase-like protein (cupin superfamily)
MRSILNLSAALAALAIALPAAAQTTPSPATSAPQVTFASAADVAALVAKEKVQIKPGAGAIAQPILLLAPYRTNIEYRNGRANAAVHEIDAEMFYVIDGSGTFALGGQLTNPKRTNEHNLSGDGITGGEIRQVSKGDLLFVPQNTPHQVIATNGELILLSMHVPRP